MKKFTAILLAAMMVLSLTACSSGNNSESSTVSDENSSSVESGASDESETSESETSESETSESETSESETSESETSESETSESETSESETSKPETSEPETSKPETSKPETSKPETSKPETSKPETSKPETSKPETSKPETSKPETSKPETSKPETSEPEEVKDEISDPTSLLNNIWALFKEDEQFPATGGDFSSGELIEGAGSFSLEEPDSIDYVAGFPAAEISKIDSAATLMHMMNQNTFTAGAYHVVDPADMASLEEALKTNIMNRMWMCGFPDKMIVAEIGDYIVCAFGKNQQINAFTSHITEAYPSAKIVVDEPIL
ncbi:MAG: hypothetical protein J6A19_16360 [Oscillospiraceae bacterium]|nr:hypothetical protein [Oscillospiraceae bacterium]